MRYARVRPRGGSSLLLNGTLVGIDAPEDVNESCIASFLSDAVTIVVAARYREKRMILPMFFGLLSVGLLQDQLMHG